MSKKALLIIAHGSRRASSNDEVRALAAQVAASAASEFDIVEPAFLELADPDIVQGFEACVAQGAEDIVALPYFLSAGRHVVEDIPQDLEKAHQRHPQIRLTVQAHLGQSESMPEMVLRSSGQNAR